MDTKELLIFGLCGQSVFLTVPHFHRPQETLHATALFTEPGGKGYNQAVAAARLRARVAFVGAVGRDADGEACLARLLKEKVRARLVPKQEGHTAYAAILTDAKGENRVTVYPGVGLAARDVKEAEAWFQGAELLLLTPEIPREAFAQAVALGKKHGLRLVVNPAPFAPWVLPYLKEAWCVTPNRMEARQMLGLAPEEDLERAAAHAPYPRMVITLGGEGVLCLEEGILTRLPAPKVKAVDTTGAGDALTGALCAALLRGLPLAEAAALGVRAAALSVTRPHVLDGLPTWEEWDAFPR